MPGQYGRSYQVSFHNSHVLLADNDLDGAYRYTLETIEGLDNAAQHPLYPALLFIKAKIQFRKQLNAEALRSYLQLIDLPRLDTLLRANCYTNIAEIYVELKQYNTALQYFNAWERKFSSNATTYTIKSVFHNKALCFFLMGRYKEAEQYFGQSMQLEEALHDTAGLAISYMDIANLYYTQYLDAKAIPYFEKGLQLAQRAGDVEILCNAYKNMAVVEEDRKRYPQALQYRRQYEALQDTIWNRDRVWELARLERKLALQTREHTIRVLGWQRNTLLLAAVGFLVLATGTWFAYRQLAKRNRIIAKQKEALNVLNQTKDRLFSIVAHDLRSPVYRMKANLARLKKAIWQREIDEAATLVASNEKIAGSTYILMDNLLHWALSQTDQLFFQAEKLHLRTVINLVCHDLAPLAADKNIMIHQVIPEPIFFTADLHSFKIIIRNMMDNAIKFTPNGGEITISAALQQQECCIRIADNGIGMDAMTLQALFDPDRKRVQTDTHGNESTGLGLWLCKTMTEKNNGRLSVASEQGKGTTITICLRANV